MNILREIRRTKKRSVTARIALVMIFASFLIINTFAWYNLQKDISATGLTAVVRHWDIEFYNDSEVVEDEIMFTVDEMYPGMPYFEENVYIRNSEDKGSRLKFTLKSIKLFGELIYSDEEEFTNTIEPQIFTQVLNPDRVADGEEEIHSGRVVLTSAGEIYPFTISYSYNRDKINGKYEDDIYTPNAYATFTMNIEWDYELLENGLASTSRDNLDTEFAKRAYSFYQNEENENTNAIEIKVELFAKV